MDYFNTLFNFLKSKRLSGCSLILDSLITHRYENDPSFIYPYYLNIVLTQNCNTKCLFCSSNSKAGGKDFPNINTVCEAIKADIDKSPPLAVALGGGEPMLYPVECLKLMRLCKPETMLYLLTNLNYELSPAHFEVFDEMSKHKMSLIQTSFDTLDLDLVQYLRNGTKLGLIQDNLRKIKDEYGFTVKVNITISDYNYSEIESLLMFCKNENIECVHCNYVLPLGRGGRNVTLASFFNVLNGLHSVVNFNSTHGSFDELTINIPVEVIIIHAIFKFESCDIAEDVRKSDLSSKQYVCNIDITQMECFAGWEGSIRKCIGTEGFVKPFSQAVCSPDIFRTIRCGKCEFRKVCNNNTAYFDKCFLELYKAQIEVLLQLGSKYSKREISRNAVLDLLHNSIKSYCIDLAITHMCNGHCSFCQASGGHLDVHESFLLPDFSSFVGNNDVHVTITGGEPLIKQDYVEEIVRVVKCNTNSVISILTNLSLLNDKLIASIVKNFGYYDVVQVSVYSSNPITHKLISGRDDWEIVSQNIVKLVSAGVQVRANLTLTMDNMYELEDTYQYYRNLGVDHVCISCLLDKGFAKGMVDEEYLLKYIFETSRFSQLGYDAYNIVIPARALRCYHNCLTILDIESEYNSMPDFHESEMQRYNPNLHIEYNGDIFYSDSMEYIGSVSNTKLPNIATPKPITASDLCQKCRAFSICGGKTCLHNKKVIPACMDSAI